MLSTRHQYIFQPSVATKQNIFSETEGDVSVVFVATKVHIFNKMSEHFPAVFAVTRPGILNHQLIISQQVVFVSKPSKTVSTASLQNKTVSKQTLNRKLKSGCEILFQATQSQSGSKISAHHLTHADIAIMSV